MTTTKTNQSLRSAVILAALGTAAAQASTAEAREAAQPTPKPESKSVVKRKAVQRAARPPKPTGPTSAEKFVSDLRPTLERYPAIFRGNQAMAWNLAKAAIKKGLFDHAGLIEYVPGEGKLVKFHDGSKLELVDTDLRGLIERYSNPVMPRTKPGAPKSNRDRQAERS